MMEIIYDFDYRRFLLPFFLFFFFFPLFPLRPPALLRANVVLNKLMMIEFHGVIIIIKS